MQERASSAVEQIWTVVTRGLPLHIASNITPARLRISPRWQRLQCLVGPEIALLQPHLQPNTRH